MKFSFTVPRNWKELQELTAKFLNGAEYKAITPYIIDTVRGKVEVDVFIATPNEFVKKIICECKNWNRPITKEKIHAFRTVVHDCGAELGIIISKNGYQKGAKEAAMYSNIRLDTWESFLDNIKEKWIDVQLWNIKKMTARVMSFADKYTYESEKLQDHEYELYSQICIDTNELTSTALSLRKSDLISDTSIPEEYLANIGCKDIESYLNSLSIRLQSALEKLEKLSVLPIKSDRFLSAMKNFME